MKEHEFDRDFAAVGSFGGDEPLERESGGAGVDEACSATAPDDSATAPAGEVGVERVEAQGAALSAESDSYESAAQGTNENAELNENAADTFASDNPDDHAALADDDTSASAADPTAPRRAKRRGRAPRERKRLGFAGVLLRSLALMLAGALTALIIVPNPLRLALTGGSDAYSKLSAIEQLVKSNYFDADALDEKQLTDMLATGYIYGIGDDYAAYLTADEYKQMQYSNEGGTTGIGVIVTAAEDSSGIYVIHLSADSPAEKAGLAVGDIITSVGEVSAAGDGYAAAVKAIRGDIGTSVQLTVRRGGASFNVTVERGNYTQTSVFSRMIGTLGYIEIMTFNSATVDQFKAAVEQVQAAGATGIIFDLRDNGGGLVDAASEMLDLLLPEGEIGYAVYNSGRRRSLATSDKACVDLPFAVIVNGETASSSEYFASALRDSANAVLVGETTFGKGIMQRTYPLTDGSAVRITIARFYTESGAEFHGKGLAPDVKVSFTDEQLKHRYFLSDSKEPFIAAAVKALGK